MFTKTVCGHASKLPAINSNARGRNESAKRQSKSAIHPQSQFPQAPEVVIRREFWINGQIGKLGQKDKLSYINLIHQIETGKRKGHNEAEIVEAVVRAALQD